MNQQQRARQRGVGLYPHWQLVFDKYDLDSDGRISLAELRNMLRSESFENDIPKHTVRQIMEKADKNRNGYLEFPEFLKMTEQEEVQGIMKGAFKRYIRATVPPHKRYTDDEYDGSGDYEREYTCCPPPVLMIIISLLEVIAFLWDVIDVGASTINGPAASLFIYNPFRRYEAWRYLTYMFVHVGVFHLVVNLFVQIMLGIPLEMVHGWWRVLLVYLAGVVAGSLGTSISDPGVYLAGASGGVYAIVAAHLATLCLNWSEMEFAILQLLAYSLVTIVDVATAIYTRYVKNEDSHIGYVAHLGGALAGLLVGINVLRNLRVTSWEKKLWWISIILYTVIMLAAIIWNAGFPSYFPPSH